MLVKKFSTDLAKFEKNERVKILIKEYADGKPYRLAKKLGYKRADKVYYVADDTYEASDDLLNDILKVFKNISRDWLFFGDGPKEIDPSDALKLSKSAGLQKAEKLLPEQEQLLKEIESLKKQLRDKDELLDFYRKEKK